MRKEPLLDLDLENEIVDDFGELEEDNLSRKRKLSPVKPIHSDKWTIVDAFNTVNEHLPKSQLGKDLYIKCAEAFSFLSSQLDFNPIQCVVIAMLVEEGKPMSFRQMGKILGVSRLSMMTHYNDIEDLFKRHWLRHRGAMEQDGMYDGYALERGVVSAIRENRPFIPEDLKCADTQEFVERLASHLSEYCNDEDLVFDDEKVWINDFVNENKELPICKKALTLNDIDSMSLLMLVVSDYCNFNGLSDEGIGPSIVQMVYPRHKTTNYRQLVTNMQTGKHRLFLENLIEHKCEDGIANQNLYVATAHLKNEILADFNPQNHSSSQIPKMNGLKSCKDITPKSLFYNKEEENQIVRLKNLLSKEQLPLVQERLKEKGMRTGVCILMHGEPGTGKTATAYELARLTGRDIIQVQVTDFKDKYVGESENKLKGIFNDYRTCCKNSETAPILLLNEGDAILSKRTTNIEKSVDQMANALQNILLEEMENLEGIMIVTTNLISNLDSAFERRFIFKIQFDKPDKEVRANIWKSMIDTLNDEDSWELAETFDMSGGEIENIARKTTMEYILTGKKPDVNMIKDFAKDEKLKTTKRPIVGFHIKQVY